MKTKIERQGDKVYHYVDDIPMLITDIDSAFIDEDEFDRFCDTYKYAIDILKLDAKQVGENDRYIPSSKYAFINIVDWMSYAKEHSHANAIHNSSFIYSKRPVECGYYHTTYDLSGLELGWSTKLHNDIAISELAISGYTVYGNSGKLMPQMLVYTRERGSDIHWLSLSADQYEEFKNLPDNSIIYCDLVDGTEVVRKSHIDYISVYNTLPDIFDEIPFD